MPTNTAATGSLTLTYGLPEWQIEGYPQSRHHVIPFLHPPLREVWLLPKDSMDTISTTTWGLPNNNSNTKICLYCLLSQINSKPQLLSQQMSWLHRCLPAPTLVSALYPPSDTSSSLLLASSHTQASSILLSPRPPLPCSPMPLMFVLHPGCWQNPTTITSYSHVSLQPSSTSLLPSAF